MSVTTFYFEIPELMKQVHNGVLDAVRNSGKADDFVSNDDEGSIDGFLRSISTSVFSEQTSPLARGLASLEEPVDAFEYDVTYNDGTDDHDNSIVFRVEFPDKFDVTSIPAVTRAIEETLVSYCIFRWLKRTKFEDWRELENDYQVFRSGLVNLITRRVGLTRTYKLY